MVVKEAPSREAPKRVEVQQVPIAAIFNAEFQTLNVPPAEQEKRAGEYEKYATGLMNSVSVWLGFGDAGMADKGKLAEAINKADERELFEFLIEVFHKDFKASFEADKMLATSIEDNVFNCYSSTVLLGDVLARLGKEANIIIAPVHVLLAGSEYALETTSKIPFLAVYKLGGLDAHYSSWQEAGVENLLGITYDWCGSTLDNMGRFEEALSSYDQALKLNPKHAGAWNNRGITLSKLGRSDEALLCYDKAIGLNPKNEMAWYGRGSTLDNMGRFEEALSSYDKALEINPRLAEVWYNRGNTLFNMTKYDEALPSYDKALELNPKDAEVWDNRGITLSKLGRSDEALLCYDKAIGLNPKNEMAWYNKGVLLEELGRKAEAEECFKKAKELEEQKK